MDNKWTGFLAGEEGTTRVMDEELLDRLDYFVYQLKQHGIFINLNLNVARRFEPGDDVKDTEYLGYAKAVTYFDERLIELQKEFAKQLLTHFNPYTETEYADEPAVAIVEIVNENSLVEYWMAGRLHGLDASKDGGTWSDIPPSYAEDLTQKYNAWLKENVTEYEIDLIKSEADVDLDELAPRLKKNEFDDASVLRFNTEAQFYIDVERQFMQEMETYLKNRLYVKAHIVGSSDHNHYRSGYPHLIANSELDVIDGHVYWQHPSKKTVDGKRTFTIDNTPMVNDPFFSTVVQLSRTAMAGKPYTVSETNHPYPNEFACEGVPVLAAYALLQDWDGIFFYTFEHRNPDDWHNRQSGHFDFRPDPVKMANIAACSVMFHRGDVREAQKTIYRSYSREQIMESMRLSSQMKPYFTPGFSEPLPLLHKTRIMTLNGKPSEYPQISNRKFMASDTGQLTWNIEQAGEGVVIIDTPKTQGLIGFISDGKARAGNLSVKTKNPFASVLCSSLDGEPIGRSKHMLVTATAKALNAGTVWNHDHTTLLDWGEEPMQIEPVVGTLQLRNIPQATELLITPLDGSGRPMAPTVSSAFINGWWNLALGNVDTVWYLVEVK
jgi:hypothetical protein